MSGSAAAKLIKWTSHVSGKAETIFTPDRFSPLYTILEFSTETGMGADCSTNTYNKVPRQRRTFLEKCSRRPFSPPSRRGGCALQTKTSRCLQRAQPGRSDNQHRVL